MSEVSDGLRWKLDLVLEEPVGSYRTVATTKPDGAVFYRQMWSIFEWLQCLSLPDAFNRRRRVPWFMKPSSTKAQPASAWLERHIAGTYKRHGRSYLIC
jgi:hypothetical protein